MELDELYQEVILDHFKHPRCHGCLEQSTATSSLFNPLCGDKIQLTMSADGKTIQDLGFAGHGCSISQASASMMTSICRGRTLEEARGLMDKFRALMRGEMRAEEMPELGDAVSLEGVRKFSARVKCATLAWEALEKCLEQTAVPVCK